VNDVAVSDNGEKMLYTVAEGESASRTDLVVGRIRQAKASSKARTWP
jgi:hypothetical protein